MVTPTQLETSKEIQQRTGRTFHVATRFLPERVRHPTYVLYAFFRVADDVVDDPDPGPAAERREALERFRAAALGERPTDDPVLAAVSELRERHDIPDHEIQVFLDAMASDVDPDGFDTYADLEGYLRGSAVAVANMMLAVMDPENPETARPHARALGEAFQLTNFLRDVREDVTEYGRIYLPGETLATYGVAEDEIRDLRFSDGFAAAMRNELRRAEERYREGVAGIRLLPDDCQFPVLLSAVLYGAYHAKIRGQGYDVLASQPSLTRADYLSLVARTWVHWRLTGDPEPVFYRVTDIDRAVGEPSREGSGPLARWGRRASRPVGQVVDGVRAWLPVGRVD